MSTLIIPCAGKSSRFPNMKPKYLLTHPDGKMMIEKSIEEINTEIFSRIIITIVKPHDDQYESSLLLNQVFKNNPKVEICVLDDFTKSASETIHKTITKTNVSGSFVIKDSDNSVGVDLPKDIDNAIVGLDLHKNPNIKNIAAKSFLIVNEQDTILDIVEKQVVSNVICLGIYCFKEAAAFLKAFEEMSATNISGEMFISHVISYMLRNHEHLFNLFLAKSFKDFGTLEEWKEEQFKHRTYFVDFDGVLVKNSGKYGKRNWSNNFEILEDNAKTIRDLQQNGAQIIITTARSEELRPTVEKLLEQMGIKVHAIVMNLNHSSRVLINDFAATNPYPSALAISIPRDSNLKNYF